MTANELILLIALAVALGTFGLAQLVVAFIHGDRQRLQQRLASEWRSDVNALYNRAVSVEKPLKELPDFLARNRFLQNLNRKLRHTNPDASLTRFLLLAGSVGLVCFVFAAIATDSLLIAFPAAAAGSYLPVLLLESKRKRRQRKLAEQLPEALDFLSRVLKAGHSLSTGLQMMGDELPQPIASEFRRCYDQHSLGQSLEEAMREMANGVESTDFAFFVTAVLIQRQTGGDLSEVLNNISTMVRSRIRLQQHVKAITAEGRLTGYVLVAFPAILFAISYVLRPQYSGVLLTTDVGNMLLVVAVALQIVGLCAIRRIVAVKV